MEFDKILSKLIDKMQNAFAYHKIIVENGEPVDYEYIYVNSAFEELTGLKKDFIIGKKVTQVIPGIEESEFSWIKYYGNIAENEMEDHVIRYFDIWDRWYKIDVFSPVKGCFATFFSDITDIKNAEEKIKEQNEIINQITENLEEVTFLQDIKTRKVIYISSAFEKLYGIKKQEVYNNPRVWENAVHPNDKKNIINSFTMENAIREIKRNRVFFHEYRVIDKNKKVKWVRAKTLPIYDSEGNIKRLVGIEQDITQQKIMENKLKNAKRKAEKLAMYDYLTNLYNRRAFFIRAKEEINRAYRKKEPFSVILTDIDRFKLINDKYGHIIGDKVLKHFSHILKKLTRKYDIAARFGGEEFIIFLSGTDKKNAIKKAELIRKTIEETPLKDKEFNLEIYFTSSFGVSEIKAYDDYKIEKMIIRADQALYAAKNSGRNKVCSEDDINI